ncbi:MAG: transketolase [Nitrospirae bacterium]|nr:transketolase [Nitrospirota bacterium]
MDNVRFLKDKSLWVRKETLNIHRIAQDTRLASSLSAVEIFVVLFYGGIINFDPKDPRWDSRDRFIISKGHGSISFYPILADLGYFNMQELKRVGKEGSFLGAIPDPIIPGYDTVNGSLGHGLGIACGVAIALKRKGKDEKVFVLIGDGELYEGSVWEAAMFAGEHGLDNLIMILDNNKACMLDYCKNVIDLEPIEEKFKSFRWTTERIDGHDVEQLYGSLKGLKEKRGERPKLLIADTIKGKGVPFLETDPLSHIKNIKPEDIDGVIEGLK